MQLIGWLYIIVGVLLSLAAFTAASSDIQLILGFVGINIIGTGLLLIHKGPTHGVKAG